MGEKVIFLLSLLIFSGTCIRFQIFKDFNQKGLIFDFKEEPEENSTLPCTNVKPYAQGIAGSVRIDTCLIAYEEMNCKGKHVKIAPGMDTLARLNRNVYSFLQCNKTFGGDEVRGDLYAGASLKAEYVDICGCQEIPTQVSSTFTRMNNYGNCIEVFASETCSGEKREIPAGKNDESENLDELPFYIRSFKACGANPACIKLRSTIYRFELDFSESSSNSSREVELAAKTTFYNNGSATVTQEYEASKTVRQSFTITRSKSVTEMESSTVEKGTEVGVEFGLGLDFKFLSASMSFSITESLKEAFTFEKTTSVGQESSFTYEEEKTFKIRQEIQIPPCVEYSVNSMVSIMEKVPVKYWIFTKVSGDAGGVNILADEVRSQVNNMTWVENLDDFTAVFKTENIVFANVGVDTWITGEGSNIENCQAGLDKEEL